MDTTVATAHLLYGFVGAGKTMFALALERECSAVRFTHDEWMHRLYGPNPDKDEFAHLHARVSELIWQQASRLLELGVDVVLDFGFWSRESRDMARSRVAQLGGRTILYHVTCPEQVMRHRVLRRSEEVPADSLLINDEAFELFKTRFEALDDDEERVLVDGVTGRRVAQSCF